MKRKELATTSSDDTIVAEEHSRVENGDTTAVGSGMSNEQDGNLFRGVALEHDDDGRVVVLTTAGQCDHDRWKITTPSLHMFPFLRVLELSKCRYLEYVDESLAQLKGVRTLRLTRCSRLERLPEDIGQLENLEEVSLLSRKRTLCSLEGQKLLFF